MYFGICIQNGIQGIHVPRISGSRKDSRYEESESKTITNWNELESWNNGIVRIKYNFREFLVLETLILRTILYFTH